VRCRAGESVSAAEIKAVSPNITGAELGLLAPDAKSAIFQ
jgi:hypothetical protein